MTSRLPSAIACAVAALAAGLAGCGGSEKITITQAELDRRAEALVTNAARRAVIREPGCSPGTGSKAAIKLTRGAADRALVAKLGVLRRKSTAAERRLINTKTKARVALPFFADRLYTDATRIIDASDRRRLVLAVGHTDQRGHEPKLGAEQCGAVRREALESLAEGELKPVRNEALRLSDKIAKLRQPPTTIAITRYPGDARLGTTGGGPLDANLFASDGVLVSGSSGKRLQFYALVPDGVDNVTAVFGNGRSGLPSKVRDNLAALIGPATGPTTYPTSTVWRNKDGKVIRRVEHEVLESGFEAG